MNPSYKPAQFPQTPLFREHRYQEARIGAVDSLIRYDEYCRDLHSDYGGAAEATALKPEDVKFTCDICVHRLVCEYALDDYNQNGDCLASK